MTRQTVPAWLSWSSGVILSAISAGLGVMGYAYTNFQTVRAAEREQDAIVKRLDRIEDKLDRVLETR